MTVGNGLVNQVGQFVTINHFGKGRIGKLEFDQQYRSIEQVEESAACSVSHKSNVCYSLPDIRPVMENA